jgi:hypothetical protein
LGKISGRFYRPGCFTFRFLLFKQASEFAIIRLIRKQIVPEKIPAASRQYFWMWNLKEGF